jgi:hypothetical protein
MDNGYVAPGDTLDDDYDVSRQLEPEETVGIMDAMLCSEVFRFSMTTITLLIMSVGSMAHGSSSFADTVHFSVLE